MIDCLRGLGCYSCLGESAWYNILGRIYMLLVPINIPIFYFSPVKICLPLLVPKKKNHHHFWLFVLSQLTCNIYIFKESVKYYNNHSQNK